MLAAIMVFVMKSVASALACLVTQAMIVQPQFVLDSVPPTANATSRAKDVNAFLDGVTWTAPKLSATMIAVVMVIAAPLEIALATPVTKAQTVRPPFAPAVSMESVLLLGCAVVLSSGQVHPVRSLCALLPQTDLLVPKMAFASALEFANAMRNGLDLLAKHQFVQHPVPTTVLASLLASANATTGGLELLATLPSVLTTAPQMAFVFHPIIANVSKASVALIALREVAQITAATMEFAPRLSFALAMTDGVVKIAQSLFACLIALAMGCASHPGSVSVALAGLELTVTSLQVH